MRRLFGALLLSSLLFGCQSSPQLAQNSTAPRTLSILQGATDTTSTILNIVVPMNKKYKYSVLFDSTVLQMPPLIEKTWPGSSWKVVSFQLTSLTPGSVYDLLVADDDGEVIDRRTFKTLAADLKNPSVAIVSCLDDNLSDLQKSQWQEVWFQKPDAVFMIGDNVYVDTHIKGATDKDIWQRYIETRQNLALFKNPSLLPIFATWDDHDFGTGDGDSSFAFKNQSREIFQTFFPSFESKSIKKGPGVASAMTIGKQTFVFFDDRSFRTKDRVVPNDTHFGSEQEDWFFKIAKKSKGPLWLIDGDQFFGGYHTFESFEGNHPNAFKRFMRRLKSAKKTVIFVSGDRHMSEVMKIPKSYLGYTTYEFTSSGLHASLFPGAVAKFPNPKQIFAQDTQNHFLILKSTVKSARAMKLDATFYGPQSSVLFRQSFEVNR